MFDVCACLSSALPEILETGLSIRYLVCGKEKKLLAWGDWWCADGLFELGRDCSLSATLIEYMFFRFFFKNDTYFI